MSNARKWVAKPGGGVGLLGDELPDDDSKAGETAARAHLDGARGSHDPLATDDIVINISQVPFV
jgi:hypothetical protein